MKQNTTSSVDRDLGSKVCIQILVQQWSLGELAWVGDVSASGEALCYISAALRARPTHAKAKPKVANPKSDVQEIWMGEDEKFLGNNSLYMDDRRT